MLRHFTILLSISLLICFWQAEALAQKGFVPHADPLPRIELPGGRVEMPGDRSKSDDKVDETLRTFKGFKVAPDPKTIAQEHLLAFLDFAETFLKEPATVDRLGEQATWGGIFLGFSDRSASETRPQYDTPAAIRLFGQSWQLAFSVATVNLLPRTVDEFKRIFDSDAVSQKQVDEMDRLKGSSSDNSAIALDQALNTPDGIVVFIGHSENGFLKDRDGRPHSLRDLATNCARRMKLCMFLSCYSGEFVGADAMGPKRAISAREALDEANHIRDRAHDALAFLSSNAVDDPGAAAYARWIRYRAFVDVTTANISILGGGRYEWFTWQSAAPYGGKAAVFVVLMLVAGSTTTCPATQRPC